MQTLCKSFLMSEEFEDPHGHYTLEIGLLHVKYRDAKSEEHEEHAPAIFGLPTQKIC